MFCYILLSSLSFLQMMESNQLEFQTIAVSYSNEFPHFSDKLFYMQFSPRIGEFPIFSMLIFIIRDGLDILEKGYFYPGFFYELEYPFIGNYFELLVATVLRNHSINLRIKFNEKANFKHFEIRYGEFVSKEKMLFGKTNYLLLTSVKYSKTVHLYVRTHLEIKTLTLDGRTDGLLLDEPGFLQCRGSRGYPEQRVEISGQHQYEVLDSVYDSVTNTHTVKAMFKLYNHRSRFQCFTKDSQAEYEIHVFHHPTQLHLEPAYYRTVPNGSSVQCVADNGYPQPRIQWHFIRGPFNFDWYFNIFQDQLFILSNAPIDSAWTFNCVADNVIPSSRANSTSLLFEFSIVHSGSRHIIVVAASAGTAVVLLVVVVAIVILFRPRNRRQRRPPAAATAAKNGAGGGKQVVTARKELAFDPDTAGSLRLSSSTECLPDELLPRYDDTELGAGGNVGNNSSSGKCQEARGLSKENSNTCYV